MTMRPFPGADAHPDKRGGELCVEGTRVPVARILAELAEVANPAEAGRGKLWCHGLDYIVDDLDLDFDTVQKCLRGLADWLKTQNWSGWSFRFDGTQTGRWISGEELAAFRRWQAREEGKQQQAAQAAGGFRCPKCKTVFLDTGFPRLPGERGDGCASGWQVTCPECKHEWNCLNVKQKTERRCENCVSWLPELLRTDKCAYPYSPKSHDTAARAEGCGHWLARSDAPVVCPRCRSANISAGKCNDCPFERSDPLGAEGPSVKDRLADLEKDVQQLLTLEEEREADEKHAAEKRCGMCGAWINNGGPCGGFFLRAAFPGDGPPWDSCRFWKPKE